jgi:hypothetical protein
MASAEAAHSLEKVCARRKDNTVEVTKSKDNKSNASKVKGEDKEETEGEEDGGGRQATLAC